MHFALSMGSLLFSGSLAVYLPYEIRIALATTAIMMVCNSPACSIPGVVGSTQDSTSVILAINASFLNRWSPVYSPGQAVAGSKLHWRR
jgi:hypothetical protein